MHQPALGNRDLMRALNRSTVLNIIKTHGPIARTEVARRSGLSPATVTGITADLIAEDLVFEKEAGDSSGGRRPILLAINPTGGCVVGIKLTETQLIGALTDLEATVIAMDVRPLSGRSHEKMVDSLALLVQRLVKASGFAKKRLLGVGIGLAGIVDAENGVLRQSPYLGWRDLPIGKLLRDKVRVPVYVDNDVNTLTLAEKWFGAGQGIEHFLTVTVGRGVGLGIVVNGQFYRGAGGGAGEFGHTVIDPEGPICACGKRGCLEAFVSDPGLLSLAAQAAHRGELTRAPHSVAELISLAESGDPVARHIFAYAGEILGRGLANLINILDPQRIIVGGEGVRAGDWLFGPMRAAIAVHVLPSISTDAEIRVEPWGDDAWARGAASLVLRELFEPPVRK